MGLFDRIKSASSALFNTKKPGFAITNFTSNNFFERLIEEETNYYDQYRLYVSKCIDFVSDKVASTEFKVMNSEEKEDENNKLMRDLKHFNPDMDLWQALKLKEMHVKLTGAAYWYIDRDVSSPEYNAEFYPLDPTQMSMRTNSVGLPDYFEYEDADGKVVRLDKEDVIYFRKMDPQNWFGGISELKLISDITNAHAYGAKMNLNQFLNSGRADGYLVFDGVNDEQRRNLEDQLRNKYGGVKNKNRVGVLNVMPEFLDMSKSNKELDYINGMKMMRQDILAMFGIPEAILFPSATKSNSKEARTSFQADTLKPAVDRQMAVFNEQLLTKYYGIKQPDVKFVAEEVVMKDKNELVDQAVRLTKAGILTRNRALEYLGEETVEDGDVYLNSDSTVEDQIQEAVEDKTKSIAEDLENIKNESKLKAEKQKQAELTEEQEGLFIEAAKNLFTDQAESVIDYINSVDNPTVKNSFDYKEQVKKTKQVFKEVYESVINSANEAANNDVKMKLYKASSTKLVDFESKGLSPELLEEIDEKLDYFSGEINKTTRDKVRAAISRGIQEGFGKTQFRQSILEIFNGYIDGNKNIDILESLGFYEQPIGVDKNDSVVRSSNNRYNNMLEKITQAESNDEISASERDEALTALRGVIDENDPVGKQVGNVLTNLYGINKNKGISKARATTIARTESTYAANAAFEDTYENNPFVTGRTWIAADDRDTRQTHNIADNTTVEIGKNFQIGQYEMKYPGDTSLGAGPEEIVNCRCRIVAEVE